MENDLQPTRFQQISTCAELAHTTGPLEQLQLQSNMQPPANNRHVDQLVGSRAAEPALGIYYCTSRTFMQLHLTPRKQHLQITRLGPNLGLSIKAFQLLICTLVELDYQ